MKLSLLVRMFRAIILSVTFSACSYSTQGLEYMTPELEQCLNTLNADTSIPIKLLRTDLAFIPPTQYIDDTNDADGVFHPGEIVIKVYGDDADISHLTHELAHRWTYIDGLKVTHDLEFESRWDYLWETCSASN